MRITGRSIRVASAMIAVVVVLGACGSPDESSPRGLDCGAPVAKATGGAWRCTFADDFDGDHLDPRRWIVQKTADSGFRNGPECYGSPANVAVADGILRLTARREAAPFVCRNPGGDFTTQYSGGFVSTWRRFSQTYGRFEIRARMPKVTVKGIHSALWLWPQYQARRGAWPTSGEIDIGEFFSAYPDRVVPYLHYRPATADPHVTNTKCTMADPSAWHDYVLEWTVKDLTITYDGNICLIDAWQAAPPLVGRAPFDQPFFVILTQALGNAGNAFDPATTPLPATMQVDHVRVWK